jgi:hypothetical protein
VILTIINLVVSSDSLGVIGQKYPKACNNSNAKHMAGRWERCTRDASASFFSRFASGRAFIQTCKIR